MSDFMIKVEDLSKSFLIGHRSEKRVVDNTLRDVIVRECRNFSRKAIALAHGRQVIEGDDVEEFWALRNINFEVKQGEILGIIGNNGAGKSTLLKILSRITPPSQGRVTLRGRVSSLLEVGTGFHRELTGRENVFLNGAILGMTQLEIRKKFDEIVAFAEVEQFLDTPVKRYSSGMYVRLAFAVAAHLEPEILIVDEVLAVGDVEFQKKCLGKMDEVSRRDGRTVLLVSHNLAAISELTRRAILFDSGQIAAEGPSTEVVSTYYARSGNSVTYVRAGKSTNAPHIRRIEVVTSSGGAVHCFGEALEAKVWVNHPEPMKRACLVLWIYNQFRQPIVQAWAYHPQIRFANQVGETLLICRFPFLRLNVGRFYLRALLFEAGGSPCEDVDGVCLFEVIRTDDKLGGWKPSDCAYHDQWNWALELSEIAAE